MLNPVNLPDGSAQKKASVRTSEPAGGVPGTGDGHLERGAPCWSAAAPSTPARGVRDAPLRARDVSLRAIAAAAHQDVCGSAARVREQQREWRCASAGQTHGQGVGDSAAEPPRDDRWAGRVAGLCNHTDGRHLART
eukprot:COSAG03_NODE_12211_length_557_cov_0.552402_1_plen_136_part_01